MTLDCTSFSSALDTSAALLNLTSVELLKRLGRLELVQTGDDDACPLQAIGIDPGDVPAFDTLWFHATRVEPSTTFKNGLQPLPQVLDSVWESLGQLASRWSDPEEWRAFRAGMKGQFADQYHRKVGTPFNDGPFAFLVRDVALMRDEFEGSHDFLRIPELVEDICLSYEEMFHRSLQRVFIEATKPCIVTFRASSLELRDLEVALAYVHARATERDLTLECNTCYSGEGVAVPFEDIVRVEWVEA
jgi:hypothetical protein